ncbi:MAG TPA: response regulator [Terriglobia bacterium]|nr:response regulator [Terriglobia bacterium]
MKSVDPGMAGGVAPGSSTPQGPLRVLVIEDNAADAELCLWELKRGGIKFTADIARTREEFTGLASSKEYDIILSDYNLRAWTALDAIETINEGGKDIPFVLVTGSLADEDAVECVKKGVSDYVLKDRMARLPVAIRRAMHEKAERKARRRLEEQLQQSQKMEAIGRLAGGVAHDFNNLLTIITGYSQLILDRLDADDPVRGQINQIKEAGDRAAALTRQLLAFSRKQVLSPRLLDLNEVVAGIDKMLRRLIGEDIELITASSPGLSRVKADPGQIDQVIMNLAVNARDAMPQGGRLTIETANVTLGEGESGRLPVITPGPYVMLAISDTGTGMTEEVKKQIFEPFFTTKERGKGTGLGLSTVYGIVKQSEGYIWAYSEPGKGTSFKIYLPPVDAAEEKRAKKTGARVGAKGGSETVLVVEDNEALRSFVRSVLEAQGYMLLEAGDSEEAIRLIENTTGPIHLLLTDVVMPRMSGPELADHLKPQYPEAKVLYMSGYTDNSIVHHGVLTPGTHFLQKPFVAETLRKKIREILDG